MRGLTTVCSNSVIIMLANTGPREPPMLTPSVCSNNLLLHEKTVLVHVSRISLRRVDFLRFVSISFLLKILSKIILRVRWRGTFVKSDSTSRETNL